MSSQARPAGCPMVDGLYLRANGEIACWGHFGDIHNIARFDAEELRKPDFDLIGRPELVAIRDAFRGGRLPFPDLCPKCPVLGDGIAAERRPRRLDKLLIEPSYICQLDCPACFSAAKRRRLGSPPYLLEPDLLQAFLDRLKADGIESVRFVHLEGRGDPMIGKDTWTLIRQIRDAFPEVEIQMTSHGVYPFDGKLFECGLDVLRFSIDGATAESYERYRRGGNFETVLAHLRAIRDHRRQYQGRLRVVWKYIVFQWNDSAEELALAARLAEELEVELLFVLAEEGTGRSERLPDLVALGNEIARVAPRARTYECLDQLGTAGLHRVHQEAARIAESTLGRALRAQAEGDLPTMARHLGQGLALDPGPTAGSAFDRALARITADDPLPPPVFEQVLSRARFPSTLASLANLANRLGLESEAFALFRRYLQVGPEAADRPAVESLLLHLALRRHLGHSDLTCLGEAEPSTLERLEDEILAIDPGHRPGGRPAVSGEPVSAWQDDVILPQALLALGFLRQARGDAQGARKLFESLQERHPGSPEASACQPTLAELSAPEPAPGSRSSRLLELIRKFSSIRRTRRRASAHGSAT